MKLPTDWSLAMSGEILDIRDGTHDTPKYVEHSEHALVTSKNLRNGRVDFSDVKYIAKEDYDAISKRSKVDFGDVLFAMIGTIGNPVIINDTPNYAIKNVGLFKNDQSRILSAYLKYFLDSSVFKKQMESRKLLKGTTQKFIPLGHLRKIEIPLPPLPTQLRIVSKLEELFSELDKSIEGLKTAQQQLKVFRQSVLQWAFEGKLTNEDVREGELPEGWRWVTLSEVANVNPKLPNKADIDAELDVQFIPMKLVEEIVNRVHLVETRKFLDVQKGSYTPFIDGDILFAKVTPCMENGKIAIVENLKNGIGFGSSEFHVLRASQLISNRFLFYFIVQDRFRNNAENAMTGAVGLRRVPKQFIENHEMPLPPPHEQSLIIQEIESRLSVADRMDESIEQSLQQAEALRQSILKRAFEGHLLSE